MAETATGQAPAEQAPLDAESAVGLLESAFAGEQPAPKRAPEQAEEVPQEAESDQASDELGPDDLPDEEGTPQSLNADEFEIVHNGAQVKLDRAKTIEFAQKGFDYTRKMESITTREKEVEARLQRSAEIEQLVPHVAQELATVKAFEARLQEYANVDWVRLATEDPLEYPKHRAQYDQLVQGYQAANGQLQQKAGYVAQARQQFTAQKVQQESAKLIEAIPAWKDPAKYQAGAQELSGWLVKQGADPARVAALSDSFEVQIAYKAMLYDKLVSAKADRSKQLRAAPPVVRPGAAVPSETGRQNFQKVQTAIRKAGRQGDHRTQERLAEAAFSKAFPK